MRDRWLRDGVALKTILGWWEWDGKWRASAQNRDVFVV